MGARRYMVPAGLAAAMLLLAIACGDSDGESTADERQEVETVLLDMAATGPDDVEFFLEHSTDRFLEDFTGYSREECARPDNVEDCVGQPSENARVENLNVEGESGEGDLVIIDGGEEFTLHIGLVKEDGVWKIDSAEIPEVEIPEGVKVVEVTGREYEFQFDGSEITDGSFAFSFSNEGEEEHELVVLKVRQDFNVEDVFGFGAGGEEEEHGEEEELPPGAEASVGGTVAAPGESGNIVFEEELEPGRYAMLCFFQDEEGTPHVDLGMHAEFTVP